MGIPEAASKLREFRKDPVQMVREWFHVEPEEWQADGLRAFADPTKRRIAMKANKGPGKTAELAWMIWNFLACYGTKGSHPKGAATGITEKNLDDNLWPELSKWQQRSPFLMEAFTWTKSRIFAKDHPETWFFSKRTWAKSADPSQQADTLAGLHADALLFVLDESGGIPSAVAATAEAGLVAPWGKLVQAGNPTHLEGPLYDAVVTHREFWTVIEITGDPDDPRRSKRIPVEWAREQIKIYGRDNPWVLVNVFGQFPPASLNALLGPEEVKAAMERHLTEDQYVNSQKRLGVDVARFGDDRTVIFPRQGLWAANPVIMRGERTTAIAARIMLAKERWQSQMELIDDTGHWGHGVIDNLFAARHSPIAVQFHAPAIDSRYQNRRCEMWLKMADWIKRGGAIPYIPEMIAEMTYPTYTFAKGVFMLEAKDLVKARLGRSPDLADALALTFALPEEANIPELPPGFQQSNEQVKHDYNPFEQEEYA